MRVIPILLLIGCSGESGPPHSPSEVSALAVASLPQSADDAAWAKAPLHAERMLPQDLVEPRLMKPSTGEVDVQALSDGQKILFRLSWEDGSKNDLPGAARFSDACAVQLPRRTEADLPAPQMGEPGRPVEITYWSASAQGSVDGRPDDIHALYPNAKVDHYPFEAAALTPGSPEQEAMAKRYAPARAVGNPNAGPRTRSVQDLVAEGPGTLRPAPAQISDGRGRHDGKRWTVLITRPLPDDVHAGGRTQVAFAVWQGEQNEVGARKMRTPWIPLAVGRAP